MTSPATVLLRRCACARDNEPPCPEPAAYLITLNTRRRWACEDHKTQLLDYIARALPGVVPVYEEMLP